MMNRKTRKLGLAGVLIASAFGGLAVGLAWASPSSGVIQTLLSGPIVLDELNIKGESDTHEIEVKTRGKYLTRVVHHRVAPGGYTGWHSHPGPVFVMVTAGTLTKYEAGNPVPAVYPAGTGFVEEPGHIHNGTNQGSVDTQMVSMLLTPDDQPARIEAPVP